MNSTEYMKLAILEELKEAVKIKRVNDELLEYLASSLRYIIHYSKKYNIPIPERDKIIELMDKAIEIEGRLPPPTRNQQHFKHEDDSTEPNPILRSR